MAFVDNGSIQEDGRQKFAIPAAVAEAAVGSRALSLFRGDLESALYDAVADHVDIRFGTTVQAVAQTPGEVVVTLSDGDRLQAELLVGADGVHSRVRELVFGAEPEYFVDLGHMVGAFALEAVPGHVPEGVGTTFIGPGRTAAVMNLGGRQTTGAGPERNQPIRPTVTNTCLGRRTHAARHPTPRNPWPGPTLHPTRQQLIGCHVRQHATQRYPWNQPGKT
ncbi:FAD-dependent monooxygenase [Nocardia sp. NPDC059180]|uniref:FAD-dependent monooxygenase n=1 Tax=Nocardia sp. NPDC059180 TaxID=3346761 RepID=UPI0036AA0E0E